MAKNTIVRFAFGTYEKPGSWVWRVCISRKHGDVYINNVAQLGHQVHISLHSTGRFFYKFSQERRELLNPPARLNGSEILLGPVFFFLTPERPVGGRNPHWNYNDVSWLGWPKKDWVIIVKTVYVTANDSYQLSDNETILSGPHRAKLFHDLRDFYLIVQRRKKSPQEIRQAAEKGPNVITYSGSTPDTVDLVLIGDTAQGPSGIMLDAFQMQKRSS